MKAIVQIFVFQLIAISLIGQQFYLRGEVKDESGIFLQNVSILHKRTGYVYSTGTSGAFGILNDKEKDTLTFSLNGYYKKNVAVKAGEFITLKMQSVPANTSNVRRDKLSSLTNNLERDIQRKWSTGDETYNSLLENRPIDTKNYPVTGLALNIDRASYSNVRRFINLGMVVPPDAIRIEEMLNYFNLNYQSPLPDELFHQSSVLTTSPWDNEKQLFFINISSRKLNLDSLPPANLVFLIDVSGSMDLPNRLPLLQSSFKMLVSNLREKDTVSIVVYGGAVGVMLNPTSGIEKEKINKAIDELTPGGSTPGESGIRIAYNIAKNQFIKGGNNRVVLATDGDFNVGAKTENELDELISRHRNTGIYLTCLGVGMGNYKDSKIQTLARKGNGNFAYIDGYQEAEKILMKEFTQTLYTVADDVYLNVKFNPELVSKYRLIGFDNKIGAISDTLSVIEGGEIGSGQSMIAAFEIEPAGKNNEMPSPNTFFAEAELQYKLPGKKDIIKTNQPFVFNLTPYKNVDPVYRFASSVIMFGSVLRSSEYIKKISMSDVFFQASESANPTDVNQAQFVELVYKTRSLYAKMKKRKKGFDKF